MYRYMQQHSPMGGTDPEPEPYKHYEVHCGKCGWWGMTDQMRTIYNSNPSEPGDVTPELGCPICLSDQMLEYPPTTLEVAADVAERKRELFLKARVQLGKEIKFWQRYPLKN